MRRGAVKVERIRRILDTLDLETKPDFETAWIDGPIWLRLRSGRSDTDVAVEAMDQPGDDQAGADLEELVLDSTPSAVRQAVEQSEAAPTSSEPDAP
jgi:CBS domain-containing protein